MNRDVTVRGRRMHACLLGSGDITIVLLSGSCVPLPQLEYRPLIKALATDQFVVLLEKFGYGGSDSTSQPRDLPHVVAEYREALAALDVPLPVVLAAHSMGFLEALYWTQHYPGEVSALVGIDPATPDSYRDFDMEKAAKQITNLSQKPLLRKIAADRYCRQLFRQLEIPPERRSDLHAKALRNFAGPVWAAESEAPTRCWRPCPKPPLPCPAPFPRFFSSPTAKGHPCPPPCGGSMVWISWGIWSMGSIFCWICPTICTRQLRISLPKKSRPGCVQPLNRSKGGSYDDI